LGETAFYTLILHLLVCTIGGLSKMKIFSTCCIIIHYYSVLCTLKDRSLYLTLQHKYNRDDILLKDITVDFIREYEHYLRTVRNCANNTTVKYIRNMGKIVKWAEQKEIIRKNPISTLNSLSIFLIILR